MLWSRVYKILSGGSENLGMTLKCWKLGPVCSCVHSFLRATDIWRTPKIVCQALRGSVERDIRKDSIKILRQKEFCVYNATVEISVT